MRYYTIAGEHSGDIHGAALIEQIRAIDPEADFWACGGNAMQQAMGKPCTVNCAEMACMGLDFLKKIYLLWHILRFCKTELVAYRPHAVILIDYSGFNLKLASFAKKQGFRVYYYIPPKIWAHGAKRIDKIKKTVTKIGSILPFEVAYYQANGYNSIAYVGNPLVQKVAMHSAQPTFRTDNGLDHRPIIALLPGSRLEEVQRILPYMTTQVHLFPSYQFVVAGVHNVPKTLYDTLAPLPIHILYDQTYSLLAAAQVAIIASGSASLEAALFDLPQVLVYKTSFLTYWWYKKIVTVKHISLVNLLEGTTVVPELIQDQLNTESLQKAVQRLLEGTDAAAQKQAYGRIRALLGTKHAAQETAQMIVQDFKNPVPCHIK
ncbi:MAG TPA: lipid-A-disaccharide synthase [Amoebophilaceae bacterium]|jgi:lipid-A-disaccharide synthase|nr:lipid-A-disaccharide synthase [Amoebophilaceae bacterium]